MSWLLFMDESGHDHKSMPYEVRGGIAVHAGRVWPLVRSLQALELTSFGTRLSEFKKELKGHKLLDKDRIGWAKRAVAMSDPDRQKLCRSLFTKGLEKRPPIRDELTAYGQACWKMATGAFQLLEEHEAKLFACAIPRGTRRPPTFEAVEYLRKDHVFLFERFFYFLEQHKQHGLLVLDESDETEDRRFISRCQRYFEKTQAGRHRTQWIVPTPFFVSSALTYPIQIADLCIYCVNRGFRTGNMNAVAHDVIGPEFGPLIEKLQFHGDGYKDGSVFKCFGIVFVPDPYVGK